MAIEQIIETVGVNKLEFQELAGDILNNLVSGINSPFNEMMDKFEAYLENNTELDATQKQAAYADMLKTTYSQTNSQALSSAMDLLKSNEQLVLERYNTEAGYNKILKDMALAEDQKELLAAQKIGQDKANQLADQKVQESLLTQAKLEAEINKQWGKTVSISYTPRIVETVDGVTTETDSTYSITVGETGLDNVIDKQIKGFDMVNLKDLLKTADERAALMQNAKVPETTAEQQFRAALVNYIADVGSTGDSATVIPDLTY